MIMERTATSNQTSKHYAQRKRVYRKRKITFKDKWNLFMRKFDKKFENVHMPDVSKTRKKIAKTIVFVSLIISQVFVMFFTALMCDKYGVSEMRFYAIMLIEFFIGWMASCYLYEYVSCEINRK